MVPPCFINLDTFWWCGVCLTPPPPPRVASVETDCATHWIAGQMDPPQSRSGRGGEERILYSCRESNPGRIVRSLVAILTELSRQDCKHISISLLRFEMRYPKSLNYDTCSIILLGSVWCSLSSTASHSRRISSYGRDFNFVYIYNDTNDQDLVTESDIQLQVMIHHIAAVYIHIHM
jgi:hypothetical protein